MVGEDFALLDMFHPRTQAFSLALSHTARYADYETLLRLDEELRASQFTGMPQSQIERLPTFVVPPK